MVSLNYAPSICCDFYSFIFTAIHVSAKDHAKLVVIGGVFQHKKRVFNQLQIIFFPLIAMIIAKILTFAIKFSLNDV